MKKCCLRGACENPAGLSMCDGPMETVGASWEVRLAGIGLYTGCRGVSGYCYHC